MWGRLFKSYNSDRVEGDDFIKRIRSLVIGEGMLHEGNLKLMEHAIKNLPNNGSVVEIGSYGGLSTNLIIHLMKKHQKHNKFFTCDAWIYEGYKDHLQSDADTHIDGRPDISRFDYSNYLKNAYIKATKFLSPHNLPYTFHMYSDQFFENWKNRSTASDIFGRPVTLGGSISFAYIDGGHSYEVAWKDFNNTASYLVQKGFILLDDSADGQNFGSSQMMNEIKKDKRFKVVFKNPNYLIQKVR